jgi:serine/threonine protein kinase
VPNQEEMTLAARLVNAGIVPRDRAQAVLRERDALKAQIGAPSLLDLLVRNDLITRTELMIFRDRPLEELQPFPNYVIHGKVAEGGMASVYRATYKPYDAQVALKVVKPELSRQERFLLRFRREAGILLKLEHPNIVRGYDLAEQERVWYCAMEFAEGRDLQSLVEKAGPLREADAMHCAVQVVRAVAYLDGRGIVHRDLKPGNVVVDGGGVCRIIDLGLCLLRGGMKEDTAAGVTVGTVEYLSPEQARATGDLDVRSDLYAIGASLHHLVTGEVPIKGESDEETLAFQVLMPFKPDRLVKAGASKRFIDLVCRLLAKDREERPRNAEALLEEMEAGWPAGAAGAVAPAPVPAPIPAPIPAPRKAPVAAPVLVPAAKKAAAPAPVPVPVPVVRKAPAPAPVPAKAAAPAPKKAPAPSPAPAAPAGPVLPKLVSKKDRAPRSER